MLKRLTFVLLLAGFALSGCSSLKKTGDQINVTTLEYPDELAVMTREEWGWTPLTEGMNEHAISKITIHHGGEEFPDDKDPVEYLRTLQSWSQSERDWIDIPYHFMIDLEGQIYETRPINYPGDTNTTYNPGGHALISVMGNYENRILSDRQLDSLLDLTAYLAKEYDVSTDDIRGHKDYAATACPGEDIYRYLQDGTIARGVLTRLGE